MRLLQHCAGCMTARMRGDKAHVGICEGAKLRCIRLLAARRSGCAWRAMSACGWQSWVPGWTHISESGMRTVSGKSLCHIYTDSTSGSRQGWPYHTAFHDAMDRVP